MSLKDCTAAELARSLEVMDDFPHNTGGLSLLDEATYAFGSKYPQVGDAQRAFADARHRHMRSYRSEIGNYSDEAWRTAMEAAHALAGALRPLGDTRIARCKRPAGFGTCDMPLADDGQCYSSLGHTDEPEDECDGENSDPA